MSIDYNMLIAANIRRLRRQAGLTQEQLAAKAGISTQHLSKVERNASSPTIKTVTALAESLGIEPSELFELDDPEALLYLYANLRPRGQRATGGDGTGGEGTAAE